jgi:DNA invertase Pin-like site-specific DNA recombinase
MALREYASARGFEIFHEYIDLGISGTKEKRPALDRLMADARKRRFDTVLVARFDRFARSTRHLVLALEEFNALGVDFISLSESIDTSTPMGKMVFVVISAVAELERSLTRERVVMGLQRAKAQGKPIGRPAIQLDSEEMQALKDKGLSYRAIARQLGVSHPTILAALNGK